MATQAQSMASSTAAPGPLPKKDQQSHSHRPELYSLPVARDRHGRSPLLLSLQSPRPSSPKPPISSPAAQLLESLTPRLTRQASASSRRENSLLSAPAGPEDKREELVLHLETCLQVSSVVPPAQEVLKACTSREGGKFVVGCGSIVACEGSPTAIRAVRREFPEAIASRFAEAEAVLVALEERKAHRGVLAVESSMEGTVHRTYDLLLRHNVHIVGELIVQDSCCRSTNDDHEEESKRFWVVARDACMLPSEEASAKTAVALVLREGLGALHKVLAAFAFRDIPITKLESRPWRAQPLFCQQYHNEIAAAQHKTYFQYVLFIEFQSSTASRAAQNALAQLQQLSSFLRLLGSYPSFHTTTTALLTPRAHIPPPFPLAPPVLMLHTS